MGQPDYILVPDNETPSCQPFGMDIDMENNPYSIYSDVLASDSGMRIARMVRTQIRETIAEQYAVEHPAA